MKWVLCLPLLLSGCLPLMVGGTAGVGSAAIEDRGLDGAASDQNIRARINYEWLQHPGDFSGIEITVYNGKVLLTGNATSLEVQKEAARLAKLAPGVREVIDAIQVGAEGDFPDLSRDAWISTKLRSAILFDEHIYSPNYAIRTEDKIVYVLGIAENQRELDAVLEHARHVTGVRRVVNLVEVKAPSNRKPSPPPPPPHKNENKW